MPSVNAIWYDVKEFLPGEDFNEGMPVRCINRDECTDFYFMAYYRHEEGIWNFLDEEYDKIGNEGMQVTHWCYPFDVDQEHKWVDGEKE